jgi:hypothetical protein
MTQLEQELTALFQDAASRLEIRPMPVRRRVGALVTRTLAAGVAAAVVAGIVLVAARMGSDGATRGGAVTPAATQRLIDALARTLGQPIRLVTTFSPNVGTSGTSVTEMDVDRQELVSMHNGEPQLLIHGSKVFEGIPDVERQGLGLPASAKWIAVTHSPRTARSMMQSAGGVLNVGQVAKAISSGRLVVTEVGTDTYQLAAAGDPTADGVETIHVARDGLFDWAKIEVNPSTGPVSHVEVTVRVSPLGRPVKASIPDPHTVISQQDYQSSTNAGQICSGGPSPAPASPPSGSSAYTSETQCSISGTVTSSGSARAKLRR